MDKIEFSKLLSQTLDVAAKRAELRTSRSIPRAFKIQLYLGIHQGELIDPPEAESALYLGPDKFYKIIDVCVRAVRADTTIVFVRPSGHAPVPFSATFDPTTNGPFIQVDPTEIDFATT